MSEEPAETHRLGFAETPSKEEWLSLIRDLSADLAAMELKIEHIRSHELTPLETMAQDMRERLDMINRRLSK